MTAWYLGVRIGIAAAAATAVGLLVAAMVPALTFTVYGLIIAWVAALYFWGPKLGSELGMLGGIPSRLSGVVRALMRRRTRRNRPNSRTR